MTIHEHEPLFLPKLSVTLPPLLNRLYAGSKSFSFHTAGHTWTFQQDATVKPQQWKIRIYAEIDEQPFAVFLDSVLFADWAGSELPLHTLLALPKELAAAAFEVTCHDLLVALEQQSGLEMSLSGVNMEPEEAWLPEEGFSFSITRDDGQQMCGAVAAGQECLQTFAQLLEACPQQRWNLSALQTTCHIQCLGQPLQMQELSDLELGDILITTLQSKSLETGLPVLLTNGARTTASARLLNTQLHMEGAMTTENHEQELENAPGENQENQDENNPQESLSAVSMDELPLPVRFELGSMELSVAELSQLAPGQILPTGRNLSEPVQLRVGNRIIGTGSFVDVAGTLGVRVESLTLK